MKTFWNTQGGLAQLTEWQPNCWIQVTCPTEEDQRELEEKFNIPDYFMSMTTDGCSSSSVSLTLRRYAQEHHILLCHLVSSTNVMSPSLYASMKRT